ncbi:MAG TPA: alpha/beta fold hydrolase [Gemmatimonadaceae bacterium]|nr:alpha/beta fold hydrolase [Gemmatimonadaceae bacterium]
MRRLLLLVPVLTLCALAAWEWRSDVAAHAAMPPDAQVVTLADGRRLHVVCRGAPSAPTVLFESGAGADGALEWTAVQDALGPDVQSCAYSRAGVLWSDPDARPMTLASAVEDLHALRALVAARCPCVLVAHSIGGPIALHDTHAHPDDIAGLVLVDITHPDELARVQEIVPGMTISPASPTLDALDALRWTALPRLVEAWRAPPDESAEAATRRALAPAHRHGQRREYEAIERLLDVPPATRRLGNRPVVVLAAGVSPRALLGDVGASDAQLDALDSLWTALQRDIATWSTRARFERVDDADHNIHHVRPDRVVAAVREVVTTVRLSSSPSESR